MLKKLLLLVSLPFSSSILASAASAQDGCAALQGRYEIFGLVFKAAISDTQQESFCRQFKALLDSVETQGQTISQLQEELLAVKRALPPKDAILLVDDEAGCPTGWTDMASHEPPKFAARVPVAAVKSEQQSPYAYRAHGGEERVTLTIPQMPKHGHPMYQDDHIGSQGNRRIRAAIPYSASTAANDITPEAGGNQSHNNMPPYIALYFCKKGAR